MASSSPLSTTDQNNGSITLLNDESISDVTLRGIDGQLVLAHRGWLAARSDVFRCAL